MTVNYERGLDKTLVVLPTALQKPNLDNMVQSIGGGAFLLIQNKQNPAGFYVQREYKLGFLTKFKDEYKVVFEGDRIIENETNIAMYFPNTIPLINNVSVKVK